MKMSEWTPHVLTAAGRKLQAKVEAGITLALTRMKLGSGLESIDEVDELLDLVAVETEIPISAARVAGETCTITGTLETSKLDHGFYCREWGVFANDPDDGEILYAVLIDEKPDWLPANLLTTLTVTYDLNIAVANATTVTAVINSTGLVDIETLYAETHAVRRDTNYKAGDIVTASSLRHGLVLEAQTDGTTADTYTDFARCVCGDIVTDGSVTWQVKRYVLTATTDTYHNADWMCGAISTLAAILKDLQGSLAITTLTLSVSSEDPGHGQAWVKPLEDIGTSAEVKAEIRLDDGAILVNPKATILSDGLTYYVGGNAAGLSIDDLMSGASLLPGYQTVTKANIDELFLE